MQRHFHVDQNGKVVRYLARGHELEKNFDRYQRVILDQVGKLKEERSSSTDILLMDTEPRRWRNMLTFGGVRPI